MSNFLSVGGLVKKLLAINPKLSPHELMYIVRNSTRTIPAEGEREAKEVLDEAKAVAFAESTLKTKT